jgi:N-acetylglucosaminyldiphosphoundecaprenol N-acetyl-beta-D-mannosaminyltransferase
MNQRRTGRVIGSAIDVLGWDEAVQRLGAWSRERKSRVVCICNAHSLVTARQDAAFAEVLRQAEMCTPDGAPVAWMLRRLGHAGQARINGPDLMWRCCAWAAGSGESVYLYGGTAETLALLQQRLNASFPALRIAGAMSPPFRPLSEAEDAAAVEAINASGAGTVWVSLGCPKQELWMQAHRGRVHAVMLGVGAAFDYHAGTIRRAPPWAQRAGLEWLHRLLSEPRRLWRRYLVTNTLFVLAAARQLLFR